MCKHVGMHGTHTRLTDDHHGLFPQRARSLGRPGRIGGRLLKRSSAWGRGKSWSLEVN